MVHPSHQEIDVIFHHRPQNLSRFLSSRRARSSLVPTPLFRRSHRPELKMDYDSNKISPEKEVSLEFVRESLMAISQSLPDVILAPNGFPVKAPVAADAVGDQNIGNGAEEYRSKLISISSMQSPDVKPSPSIVENLGPALFAESMNLVTM
ncbi:hypothetical protein OPV22_014611 [Ensete ventricosum]|uniref:Uncharacterized protein n=1 Tax=Ensete ventricosum TaxID=4639 RepID=A0AAV8R804_ENSVE|nr:hypothetical protein OPV22_014611 [Ensete ventricosum]